MLLPFLILTKKPKNRMDEVEMAKSIFDEIIKETESEEWDKKESKEMQKKSSR